MKRFRRILVGLELDRKEDQVTFGSRQAATQAAWLAERTGAEIIFVHSTYDDRRGEARALEAEHRATLEDLVNDVAESGLTCDLTVADERAWLAITRRVAPDVSDLVVVGKRDREREEGRKVGSVAVKLMRKCPAAIWVVKPEHDLVHRLVLAATDLTPVGERAVSCAAWIASHSRATDCALHLVHAYHIPAELSQQASDLSDEAFAEAVDEIRRVAQERMTSALPGDAPDPTIHFGKGAPAKVIREATEHLGPDLLCLGSLSRGGVAGVLVGSTAERLLDRVDCSVLALKPRDFISPVV